MFWSPAVGSKGVRDERKIDSVCLGVWVKSGARTIVFGWVGVVSIETKSNELDEGRFVSSWVCAFVLQRQVRQMA